MIDGINFFDQPINNMNKTLEKLLLVKEIIIQLVVCFKENYKMIAVDLSSSKD